MKRMILLLFYILTIAPVWASGNDGGTMHASVDLSDQASLQRGARIFVNYCLSCHSAAFMRFNRMGEDLGIAEDELKTNFMFGTDKPGETMTIAMNKEDARQYFGTAPPDLSVISRSRGADWLYTFFMTFYRDPSRPFGVNNVQFKDVAMPHVLWELQGWQKPVLTAETLPEGNTIEKLDHLALETPGLQSEDEYARTVNDLVNFLVYLGEPIQLKRYTIGTWVIIYLLIFLVVAYFLKREYWKDIH
jgi:ubiquinol-cytochrome c reductase cytochrome c1 subunit